MGERIIVEVAWDADASVWTAVSPAIGLFTEAETLDDLRHKVPLIASDLVSDDRSRAVDLAIELQVRFDQTVPAAAA